MNGCATCGENFGSVAAFDAHRVGKYLQTGTGEYEGPLDQWTPAKGRRCLTEAEMLAKGFVRNGHSSWSKERDVRNARRLNAARRDADRAAATASRGGGIRTRKRPALPRNVISRPAASQLSEDEYQGTGR